MRHPLSGKAILLYIAVWAAVIAAHTVFLYHNFDHSFRIALADSVLFNGLLGVYGYFYWYVVKFLMPRHQGLINVIISHSVGTVLGIGMSVYGMLLLIQVFSTGNDPYISWLNGTAFWRGVLSLFYLALMVMLYYLLIYVGRIRAKEQEENELQHMLRNAELEMLKFQLNPHFIFNSLNSISSLTITAPEQAQEMVIRLSAFLRSTLGKNNPEKHTLEQELRQINLYLDIEKVRFGERLQVVNKVPEDCLNLKLPNMLLQPLYENAIKYGLYAQLESLTITTNVTCENNLLFIQISNNFDTDSVRISGKGIGLKNVKQRLELLYNRSGLLEINEEKGNFEVKLIIPQE